MTMLVDARPGKIAPSQVGNRLDYWGHEKNFRWSNIIFGWWNHLSLSFTSSSSSSSSFCRSNKKNKNIINIVKIGTYQFVLWRLIFVDDPTVFDAQIRHHDLCCLNVVQWIFSVNLACKFLKNIGYNMVQHPSEKNITTSLRRPWNDGWRNWETIPK